MKIRVIKEGEAFDAKGKSYTTIAKRIFGRSAYVQYSYDLNSPYHNICRWDKYGCHILGKIARFSASN
jgi:hypothetical protein